MSNIRKRHTPEQVVRKLGQADRMLADGSDIAAVCRELGISEQTYYRWRNQYGGLKADDAKTALALVASWALTRRRSWPFAWSLLLGSSLASFLGQGIRGVVAWVGFAALGAVLSWSFKRC
nr:transposase [Mobilicoccus caccae]